MTSPRNTPSPDLTISHLLLPKAGHNFAECEDALAYDPNAMRFAIADGATEGFDSATWAQRLVNKWVSASGLLSEEDFWTWLNSEGKAHNNSWSGTDLPWYSMEKRRAGSFAAFVGVEIEVNLGQECWKAIALGDSCLVHVRKGIVQNVFPVSNSWDFGCAPVLAPSCADLNAHARSAIVSQSGGLLAGDKLLLLSDAIAAWFLRLCEHSVESTISKFATLINNRDETAFSEFVELERSSGRLKDDDVAIVCIEF